MAGYVRAKIRAARRNPKRLDEKRTEELAELVGLPNGGVAEISEWSGDGALHTRRELRSPSVKVQPVTVEGMWFVLAGIRGLASQKSSFGFGNDEKIRLLARQLAAELDKVLDMYDS